MPSVGRGFFIRIVQSVTIRIGETPRRRNWKLEIDMKYWLEVSIGQGQGRTMRWPLELFRQGFSI